MVRAWPGRFSQAPLVVMGACPLKDHRSCLFSMSAGLEPCSRNTFPGRRFGAESVASMDAKDGIMSEDFGDASVMIDASGVSFARRPRLGTGRRAPSSHPPTIMKGSRAVQLKAAFDQDDYLMPGCQKVSEEPLPTFTTSRPRSYPGRCPAGVDRLNQEWPESTLMRD